MKYIKAIEDSKMWKDQYEDIAHGSSKMEDGYYRLSKRERIKYTIDTPSESRYYDSQG